MSRPKILTGEELVQKGATKHDASLPEIGLKDVVPNGSWLEQKQIQAALEARKHLLEDEKIEKCGTLSHAEWDEEQGLAAVKQQAGGYWQFCGHHSDGQLYLWPEEALFLMEVNCLRLTFNEVTVSLQQAYSLLLRGKIDITQYKVYSSLSRLGYKVLRHVYATTDNGNESAKNENKNVENDAKTDEAMNDIQMEQETNITEVVEDPNTISLTKERVENREENFNTDETNKTPKESQSMEVVIESLTRKEQKLKKLRERRHFYRTSEDNSFEAIPEMCKMVMVKVGVPEQHLFPRNVFPNRTEYDLDLDRVKLKNAASPPADVRQRSYSVSDQNNIHMRRINDYVPANHNMNWNPRFMPPRFHCGPPRHWSFERPRFNNVTFSMLMQRPFMYPPPNFNFPLPNFNFPTPNFNFNQRPPPYCTVRQPLNPNRPHRERRKRSYSQTQSLHLQRIKSLSAKMKHIAMAGALHTVSVEALKCLVQRYNIRFRTNLCLADNYDLVEDDAVTTIELEEDEPPAKIPKRNDDVNKYNERFSQLKELAQTLRLLDSKQQLYSRHRRAFSNLIREFNKTYNADVFLDSDNDVRDRNLIDLDSSDSDCVVDEPVYESKKVLNPFSVLRLKSRKDPGPSTSAAKDNSEEVKIFADWLPKADDFGKREVVSKSAAMKIEADLEKEWYLFDFLKQYAEYQDYKSWNQIKSHFWELIQEVPAEEHTETEESLLKPEDCNDMPSALEKLRVISSCQEVLDDCSIEVHFDVYNKDVPNFKKSNKPKPHFRICCVSESSPFPLGAEVATLCINKYTDKVPIVFAIVSPGSIAYLQIRPENVPVYVGREE